MKLSPTLRERFEKSVSLGATGCLEWQGCLTNGGYGQISIGTGISRGAHVVAWFLAKGTWPIGILHKCDNRRCVTVAHMTEGTKGDNNQDTAKKQRFHYATEHHNGVLTDDQAREIQARRAAGEKGCDLAQEFGVSQALVSQIYLKKARLRATTTR